MVIFQFLEDGSRTVQLVNIYSNKKLPVNSVLGGVQCVSIRYLSKQRRRFNRSQNLQSDDIFDSLVHYVGVQMECTNQEA
jgi:hypothetical protein